MIGREDMVRTIVRNGDIVQAIADLSELDERRRVDVEAAAAGLRMEATPALWWAVYVACSVVLTRIDSRQHPQVAELARQVDLHYDLMGVDRATLPRLVPRDYTPGI